MKKEKTVRYYRLGDGAVIKTSRSLKNKSLLQDMEDHFNGEFNPMPELVSFELATKLQRRDSGYYKILNIDTKQLEQFN